MTSTPMISAMSRVIEAPDLWEARLAGAFPDLCPRLIAEDGRMLWVVGDARIATGLEEHGIFDRASMQRMSTAEGRLEAQARDQTDGEVLYSIGLVWNLIQQTEDDAFIIACTRAYNDWLADLCGASPDRLIGLAKIPTTGAKDATDELVRSHGLGLRGAILDAWPGGADCPPSMGECDAFWETAARLGMPLSVHRPLGGEEEPEYGVAAGVAPEYYGDMTAIIYANIPDRFPDIRFVSAAPNAGWAPSQFEALNESYMRTAALRKVNLADPDLYPSDYLRRFFFFVTQEDRVALENRAYFGEAHLMWGSFAFVPFVSEWPETRRLFDRLTGDLPDTFRTRLAANNVASLYGIGGRPGFDADELRAYDSYALL
jgi:predicted TIM-barrel fold metal-dependent hydrolase